uniref:Uncharacterized protein n=1 Tax=Poecilia mexicana TaxID=48701 RepID=A0A3B3YAN7_9TELE
QTKQKKKQPLYPFSELTCGIPGLGGPCIPILGGPCIPGVGGPCIPGLGGPCIPGLGGPCMTAGPVHTKT